MCKQLMKYNGNDGNVWRMMWKKWAMSMMVMKWCSSECSIMWNEEK